MSTRLSPTYSSRSLGSAERWHAALWAQCRLFKETFKDNYNVRLSVFSPIMPWIVKHAAWIHNRYQQHQDGKTSYERRWGRDYGKHICEFGETVLFHYSAGIPDKTTTQWDYGIWFGRCTQSDEHFVATDTNVYRTRSIRRQPLADKYKKELLATIDSTPWATRGVGKAATDDFVIAYPLPTTNAKPPVIVIDAETGGTNQEGGASSSGNNNAGEGTANAAPTNPAGPEGRLHKTLLQLLHHEVRNDHRMNYQKKINHLICTNVKVQQLTHVHNLTTKTKSNTK